MEAITRDDVVLQSDKQVSCSVDKGIVVMNVNAGEFYDLNHSASDVWRLLDTPTKVSTLCERLRETFNVDVERCEKDVLNLLNRLQEKGVVKALK
ncbi:PqqD family peptide modification chaperone [Hahella sp. KA22]|uniref:PqqD family protein n=1 Tax=Hahella sp. KA22 TaxID=1628392 RepID=UPI000FDF2B1B|nr:PqqD family protein [Hahella sp. KA22]AZZ94472.1 PqqD family protein [Hahella sp. KA22]QAY57845.1 PqqD family peptide modification chaperone [Hahella sp. KA22]